MNLIIEIDIEGAALEDDFSGELDVLLAKARIKLKQWNSDRKGENHSSNLLDTNGNTVGSVRIRHDLFG